MSFWSGEKLSSNPSVATGFSAEQVDANAYNVRMGNCFFRTADGAGGNGGKEQKNTFLSTGEAFVIPAGQFAYLLTRETVNVPANAMAFISMRTGIKFQGLINVSGFHVDPGYSGKLIYAVYNASPWRKKRYSNDLIRGMSKEIFSFQSLAKKMRDLENSVNAKLAEQKPTIDNLTCVWRAITLGVVGAILISVLARGWPSLKAFGGYAKDWIT